MPIAKERVEKLQICKLLQCVREEKREQIEKLIESGVPYLMNYNEPENGDTALNTAAQSNNDSMIEFLIDLGAHPDVVDFRGRSAVMKAAEYGHVECFEKLAKAGANMKLKDIEGKGILWYCMTATERHCKIVELAIQYGADVNNRSKAGCPVFVEACTLAGENPNLCVNLLKKGADSNSVTENTQYTALMAACTAGSGKIVAAILAGGANPDSLDKFKMHAAHYAAKAGALECLCALAAFGADFDQVDARNKMEKQNGGSTPLHYAAMGQPLCCRFLAQRGCNPKPKNNDGNVAKQLAKDNNFKDCLKELKKGEKIFGKTGKNNEPWAIRLYDWTYQRQAEVTAAFAQYDPDEVGTISKEQFVEALGQLEAPLPEDDDVKKILLPHDKKQDGNIDYGDFLIGKKYINKNYLMSAFENGGKKKKKKGGKGGKKKKGKTKVAMNICTNEEGPRTEGGAPPEEFIPRVIHFTDNERFDRDRPPVHPLQDDSAWYMQYPEKTYVGMHEATKFLDLDSLKQALERGVAVDVRDRFYKTPLMTACHQGSLELAQFLVEKGASLNAKDNFKWTPLHHACHGGQMDLVQYLVAVGADMDAQAMNGGTPIMRAIESSRVDVVEFLIQAGAKLSIENKKGQTPLDIAGAFADPRVYQAVSAKFDTMPKRDDKKKKGGKGSAKGKRPGTGSSGLAVPTNEARPPGTVGAQEEVTASAAAAAMKLRKGSILRAASALAGGGIDEREDITYIPLKSWNQQPSTEELLSGRQVKRERYGWEVDFADFQMPFMKNVMTKAALVEAED